MVGPGPGKGAGETEAETIAAEAEIGARGVRAETEGVTGATEALHRLLPVKFDFLTAAEIERTRRTRRTRSPKISGIERIAMILPRRGNQNRRMKERVNPSMGRME